MTGPAAGLTAVVAVQSGASATGVSTAVVVAGVIQILLGVVRAGFIAAFFPSVSSKGLLAAISVFSFSSNPTCSAMARARKEPAFSNDQRTYSAFASRITGGVIGLASVFVSVAWDRFGAQEQESRRVGGCHSWDRRQSVIRLSRASLGH